MNTWMKLQRTQEKGEGIQKRELLPPFFPWPTSQPGPRVTPPLPGYISVPIRTDQQMPATYYEEREYSKVLSDH